MINHKTLNELLTIQAGSKNNLFSYEAKTYKSSLLQVDIDIKKYLKAGLVQQIPFDLKPWNKRKQYFYFVTRQGAKAIDRPEDFKQKITKALNNAEHESMKFDVALAFVRNFPDYEFTFDYKADFNKLRPDIFIKAKNIHDNKELFFLVEIERKKDLSRVYREKILKYNKHIKNGLFKENGLPYQTKVLIVCATHRYDVYLRPQQYKDSQYKPMFSFLYKHFNNLMKLMKNESNEHYRLIPFPEFPYINQSIWRLPSGEKKRIIE